MQHSNGFPVRSAPQTAGVRFAVFGIVEIDAQHADELEQAAKAAQRGDMRSAAQAVQKLMQTPEGARLAAQLRHIFGK